MATKGWKQPYSWDGNTVTTRLDGRREVVYSGSSQDDAQAFCLRANCDFQTQHYGAVDSGAYFAQAALDLGYKLSYSKRREKHDLGLLDVRYGGYGRYQRDEPSGQMDSPRIDINEPNRLLDCAVRTISVGEALLGIIEMETEQGFVPLVINRNAAYLLISELAAFMAAEEVDELPQTPANDAEG